MTFVISTLAAYGVFLILGRGTLFGWLRKRLPEPVVVWLDCPICSPFWYGAGAYLGLTWAWGYREALEAVAAGFCASAFVAVVETWLGVLNERLVMDRKQLVMTEKDIEAHDPERAMKLMESAVAVMSSQQIELHQRQIDEGMNGPHH